MSDLGDGYAEPWCCHSAEQERWEQLVGESQAPVALVEADLLPQLCEEAAEDRLTSCATPDGAVWTYRHDPLGRRSAKQRLDAEGGVVEETVFTWDGTQVISGAETVDIFEPGSNRPKKCTSTGARRGNSSG